MSPIRPLAIIPLAGWGEGGGGVEVSPRKYVVQSACQYDATSRVSDFLKWRAQCSSNWRIKISIWSRKYCSDFLELEILTSLLSWKARLKYFFGMKCPAVQWILKIPFYRRANFTGNHTDRSLFWGPVHSKIEEFRHSNRRFIKGCIILYIVRIFISSELVKPRIIPLKVRLAVALKGEAKWQQMTGIFEGLWALNLVALPYFNTVLGIHL